MPKVPKVILCVESSRSSGRSLLRGIAEYARHHGPWAFYWEPGGLEKAWPRLKSLDADGIILRDVEKVEEVLAYGLPAVVIGHSHREIPGLINVVTDSEKIGRLGAEHLLGCGFREFGYCGLAEAEGGREADTAGRLPWSQLRGESFRKRLGEAGFVPQFFKVPAGVRVGSWKREQLLMAKWLKSLPKPLGLMACNDDRGQHVIEACKIAGLRVPDEVAIIGADNDELVCELSDPPMSSVAVNFERAGYESAEVLAQLIAGRRRGGRRTGQNQIVVQATHVVARQSTDILSIGDPAIAKALRFIRQRGNVAIGVKDVVLAAGLSRRVLEKRFRKLLGRSVLSEIRRVRVEQICRMLVETNESVSQIAEGLGYEGVEHFARYFRKETEMTPLGYRKRFGQK